MKTALVTGGAAGLGALIVHELGLIGMRVVVFDAAHGDDVRDPPPDISDLIGDIDILVNCAGLNRIDWLADASGKDWDDVVDVNAKGIFMMTKACLPALRRSKGTVLNIVSNAAHRPMRCSAAYNASKGAALALSKQLARELADDGIVVFSVSPNKLSGTSMSQYIDGRVVETRGWTPEQAHKYQVDGLSAGKETDPLRVAELIGFLLSSRERHEALVGCDIPYGL